MPAPRRQSSSVTPSSARQSTGAKAESRASVASFSIEMQRPTPGDRQSRCDLDHDPRDGRVQVASPPRRRLERSACRCRHACRPRRSVPPPRRNPGRARARRLRGAGAVRSGCSSGRRLARIEPQPGRQGRPAAHPGRSAGGRSSMQSTGQGGRHSSQPVHCASMTVCMKRGAPTIASTGQAGRHSAQPMQRSSSITATWRGLVGPNCGSSGPRLATQQGGERAHGGLAARRAAVDVRGTARDRLGIRPAAGIAALSALRLRQQRIDLLDQRARIRSQARRSPAKRRADRGRPGRPRVPPPATASRRS